jgi:hypothetical protein
MITFHLLETPLCHVNATGQHFDAAPFAGVSDDEVVLRANCLFDSL